MRRSIDGLMAIIRDARDFLEKNIHSGKFEKVTLIRNSREPDDFMELYDISTIPKEY